MSDPEPRTSTPVQVVSVYGVQRRRYSRLATPDGDAGLDPDELAGLGLPAGYLPRIVHHQRHEGRRVAIEGLDPRAGIDRVSTFVLAGGSGQLVAVLSLTVTAPDADGHLRWLPALLRGCRAGAVDLDGIAFARHLDRLVDELLAYGSGPVLGPDRHQLVRLPEPDLVDLPPLAAPAASVVGVAPDDRRDVETASAELLCIANLVAVAALLRAIEYDTLRNLRQIREAATSTGPSHIVTNLETLRDEIANLSMALAEALLDRGVTHSVPAGGLSDGVAAGLGIDERARSTDAALGLITRSLDSEWEAIGLRESRAVVGASLSSMVTVPFAFLAAFFSLNTSDVSGRYSAFDVRHYFLVYLIAVVLAAIPPATLVVARWSARRRRFDRVPRRWRPWRRPRTRRT